MNSGILIIDKPRGVTSHDVVSAARSALHMKKVGHAGTLDPMATGVLVIGFGNATRLLNYIVDHHKTYEATIRFGQRTTTDDADGEIVETADSSSASKMTSALDESHTQLPTLDEIRHVVDEHFTGEISQVPNAYSAIKIDGKRAYDVMRAGGSVDLQARRVTIDEFRVIDATDTLAADGTPVRDVTVRVTCSAGTYIRALGRDLGEYFGCGAHLTRLRRLRVGQFTVDDPHVIHAHTEDKTWVNRAGETVTRARCVLDVSSEELASRALTMLESVERTMPVMNVTREQATDLRYGRWIRGKVTQPTAVVEHDDGDVVAIVERAGHGKIKPVTVFPAHE